MTVAPASLPDQIPIFPLGGALMLPRGTLPLHIFEPRYLAMVHDAMAGDRLIGMVQPREPEPSLLRTRTITSVSPSDLFPIGGLGRITEFVENRDGRCIIALTGVTRFRILDELKVATPYQQMRVSYDEFVADRLPSSTLPSTIRESLESSLRVYLKAQDMKVDLKMVSAADDDALVMALAAACPFDPIDKQALLEAPDTSARAHMLSILMAFAPPLGSEAVTTLH